MTAAMARRGASSEIIQWYGTLEVIDDRWTEEALQGVASTAGLTDVEAGIIR
jgi:hypothetical protein